jgi:uncharacterized protein (TIGR02246 family)
VADCIAEEVAMARSDIDALNTTFEQALQKGDAELAASVYAHDARILPPGTEPLTGPAIRTFWQGALDAGVTDVVLENCSFEEHGEVALEEGKYEFRAGDDVVDSGKSLVVHRRQVDGGWRFGLHIWNTNRPEAAPA